MLCINGVKIEMIAHCKNYIVLVLNNAANGSWSFDIYLFIYLFIYQCDVDVVRHLYLLLCHGKCSVILQKCLGLEWHMNEAIMQIR